MEETIRDLKGNTYKLQLENLNPQQVSTVKSVLQRSEITPALVQSVVAAITQAEGPGHAGCGCSAGAGGGASIRTLAPVCPGAKIVGQQITLTSTPTGGTPGAAGYTLTFRRTAGATTTDLQTFTGVPEGSPRTMNYTLVAADVPSVTVSVYITDNCPTGAKNNTESCTVLVSSCNVPACGFVVV